MNLTSLFLSYGAFFREWQEARYKGGGALLLSNHRVRLQLETVAAASEPDPVFASLTGGPTKVPQAILTVADMFEASSRSRARESTDITGSKYRVRDFMGAIG